MGLDAELLADVPYGAGGFLLDDVLEVNREERWVRVRMPTDDDLPLTREQRVSGVHPRHVSGGLMVHMTGMAGFVHVYYLEGVRHADGWIGYGVRIHRARFAKLAPPGEPIIITCRELRAVRRPDRILSRYEFAFTQGEELVYESEQSALWVRGGVES
jgi:hypothetical protein